MNSSSLPGAILQVTGASKKYGAREVLQDVALEIKAGDIHGIIGPNGSGKSTLLKCIVGAEDLSKGSVFFNGKNITSVSGAGRAKAGMGVKFQTAQFFPTLTVRENIRIALGNTRSFWSWLSNKRSPKAEEIALIRSMSLEDQIDEVAKNLSHGEQQRLELGIALAGDPDLLLLDEPTAGMSVKERSETEQLLRRIKRADQSILIVDHDLDFVKRFSNRITVLHNGVVIKSGTTEDISNDENVRKAYLGVR